MISNLKEKASNLMSSLLGDSPDMQKIADADNLVLAGMRDIAQKLDQDSATSDAMQRNMELLRKEGSGL